MKRKSRVQSRSASYEKLEPKNLLAAIYHNPDTGVLYVAGDSGDNTGQISFEGDNVVAEIDGVTFSGESSEVKDIVFLGRDGNDTFTNLTSLSTNMYGNAGNDTLTGGSGDDNLVGGDGNDIIYARGGDDRVVGADGNDTLFGGDGNDLMFGTNGLNTIFGGSGDDTIYGSNDADVIYGDAGADKIYARGGDDTLHTGAGGVLGGSFAQGDLAVGHDGNDEFFGGSGLNIFYGGNGDDVMNGGVGENRMHGQAGADTLTGGALADYMAGGDGNDVFEGLGGVDFYRAGTGSDVVVYSTNYSPSDVFVTTNGSSVETRVQNELVSDATWIRFNDRYIAANQADYSVSDETNFFALNGHRIANSETFLSKPLDLADFARNWSLEMADQGFVSHSLFSDKEPLMTGTRTTTGENVASVADTGQSDAEIANYFHNYWQTTAPASTLLLRSEFSEVGISIVNSGGTWWATQIFAG